MMVKALYEYYSTKNVRPTYADFDDDNKLSNYANLRQNVFHRLMLPPAIFTGKRVLEFGPDTGENSLVFARWGAHLTLVEPNAEAHPYIRRYFSKFGMDASLNDVVAASLLEFSTSQKFDIIDAEGFIYTIQPNSAWIKKTGECLVRDGFLVISYMELFGGFMELLLKAIYHRTIRDPAYPAGIETAKLLFLPKWDSVQHTRKIDSWFMDVIENPFVRKKYFIDPVELLKDMHAGGFRLYSSWPNYRDAFAMHWIKAPLNQEDDLRAAISFVERSRLSHLLGCKCFLPEITQELTDNLASLLQITDELVNAYSTEAARAAGLCVGRIEGLLRAMGAAVGEKNLKVAHETLIMAKSVFQLMEMNDVGQLLIEFCRNDKTFISTWGTPAHYAVFQRSEVIS